MSRRTDDPEEMAFRRAYVEFREAVNELVDMPDLTLDRLFRFLREGEGTLPQSAREHDFRQLREDEVARVEAAYAAAFGEDVALPPPPTP